jgi:hypothetical protein
MDLRTDPVEEWSSKERDGFRNLKRELKVGSPVTPPFGIDVMCCRFTKPRITV